MRELRCGKVIGRDDERGLLAGVVSAAAAGAGSVTALVGEAGIGKSRLVDEVLSQARAAGLAAVRGRAAATTVPSPYRPFSEAFLAAFRASGPPPALRGVLRAASAVLVPSWAHAGPDVAVEPSLVLLGEAAVCLLAAVGEGSGAVVVLEDLHWADPESVALLEYVSDKVADLGVAVVVTARSGGPSEAERLLRALAVQRCVRLVELAPLSDAEVSEMVAATLGGDVPDQVTAVVAATAGGFPLLVEEVVASLVDSGAIVPADAGWAAAGPIGPVVPRSFAAAVRSRLDRLVPADRHLLLAAAIIGDDVDWRLLSRLPGADDVPATIRRCVELHLLEPDVGARVRFRHGLTRAALVESLLEPERIALARRVLAALDQDGGAGAGVPLDVLGEVAVQAQDPRASRLLLQAAEASLRHGSVATARGLVRRAMEVADDDATITAQELLVDAATIAGEATEVVSVGERLLARLLVAQASPDRIAAAHLRLARAAVVSTDWRRASGHLEAADRADPDGVGRSHRLVLWAHVALGQHRVRDGIDMAERARTAAVEERAGAEVLCEVYELLGRAWRVSDVAEAERFFDRGLATAEAAGLGLWRARALHELGTIDIVRIGHPGRLQDAAAVATGIGAPGLAAVADVHCAILHFLRYELEAAREAAERASGAAHRYRLGLLEPLAATVAAAVAAVRGDAAAAEVLADEALAASDEEIAAGVHGNALALVALCREDHATARRELEEAERLTPAGSSMAQSPYIGLLVLLRALEGHPPPDGARRSPYVAVQGYLDLARAVTLGRAGDVAAAVAAADAGDRALQPAPWFRHVARRLVGEAAVVDRWMDPGPWLRESAAFFDDAGLRDLAAATRSLVRLAGGSLPRAGNTATSPALARLGVTRREEDVLALVAEGLSSREVARRLYLSPRTVEKHVERLLQKTGTSNRAQLSNFAARAYVDPGSTDT